MARVKLIVNRDDVAAKDHALFDDLAALRGRISGPSTVVHAPPVHAASRSVVRKVPSTSSGPL